MVRAIRSVSVEKGYDVREFSLMAFGGAGPLHACEVAKELGMKEVLIPPHPGTLCSLGLLLADTKFDLSRTMVLNAVPENVAEMARQFQSMTEQGNELLDKEGILGERRQFEYFLDMRYLRQNFEISIQVPTGEMTEEVLKKVLADFHAEHKRSYGYCKEDAVVQVGQLPGVRHRHYRQAGAEARAPAPRRRPARAHRLPAGAVPGPELLCEDPGVPAGELRARSGHSGPLHLRADGYHPGGAGGLDNPCGRLSQSEDP